MSTKLVPHTRQVPVVLEDDDYDAYLEKLPDEKRNRIVQANNRMRTGLHAVAPLTCPGPAKCIFIAHCPIPERDEDGNIVAGPKENYPVGRSCVMERLYMRAKVEEYYAHLQVDPENPVEVSLVNELALIDLYKNRALMTMSQGDRQGQGQDFLKTDFIGVTENGVPLTTTQVHPSFAALEQLERRRQTLLDKLVETRRAKADVQHKLGSGGEESQLLDEIKQVRNLLLQRAAEPKKVADEEILVP